MNGRANERIAVVLFNLGGPDRPESVKPFLFNLFNDPAIISLPNPFRWVLAKLISSRRERTAQAIYAEIGGRSPLREITETQAEALQAALGELGDVGVFVAMRYWHPRAAEMVARVKAFAPDRIVLLPLYPQYSTTTTGSSLLEWHYEAAKAGLTVATSGICCYPVEPDFIAGHVDALSAMLREAGDGPVRVLFSAHGLPKKVIAGGDPYQWQVEETAAAVVRGLDREGLDWKVCYQSRVGPLEWIGPSTDDEIRRAGESGTSLVIVPIAFVSEHSETLVELDIEYRELARKSGVPGYFRVPALNASETYVSALAGLVRRSLAGPAGIASQDGVRRCPADHGQCPLQAVSGALR
ncbi:ferrochelatase [Oceanibacterium hippocampi]|uniref:Ferrochelatase n=1 Tax=Oceanibacterium hippocampi TaxID=745714 RepID=A0A1Y5RM69_9PROT|nr:ferrochelatase [Oceanibacterium hippocampi]SLN20752.1 Ferrochelatase [Oceanibacterium hippocampi]